MSVLFTRSPGFNKWARKALAVFIGLGFAVNIHYSVVYLQGLAGTTGNVAKLPHVFTSLLMTVFCVTLMGVVANSAFWGFMIEDFQEHFKKIKGVGSYLGFAVTFVILSVMFGAMFSLYFFDLITTQFGYGAGQYSIFSMQALPAWALVFCPDLGAIAWNMSNESDKRTRSLRGNGGGGRKSSSSPAAMPASSQGGGGGLGGLFK